MINVSEKYKELCESPNRPKSYVTAKYGSFDKTVKQKIYQTTGSKKNFSTYSKLYNEIKTTNYNYISCEPNKVKLDDSFYFIDNKNKQNINENIAYWSSQISNENGFFSTNPIITITFEEKIDFMELSLYFQDICKSFKVNYFNGNVLVNTRLVQNNSSLTATTIGTTVFQETKIDKIEIEFISTFEPYRYIKLNEIDFGNYLIFSNSQILDYDIIDELSLDGSELSSNSLMLEIDNSNGEYDILNPNSKLSLLQEKQEISIYHYMQIGNSVKEISLGTFLLKNATINKNKVQIEAYDQIYFMNDIYYGSNYYENESIINILSDLFEYFNFTNYILDEELKDIYLSGYIPTVSFREALRLIVEASCLTVKQNRYGKIHFFKTKNNVVKTFNRNLIFKEAPVKQLNNNNFIIKEYNYTTTEENVEIYNSELTQSEEEYIITFNNNIILPESLNKAEENNDYEILKSYATSCLIKVNKDTTIKLKATILKPISSTSSSNEEKRNNDYSYQEIDNTLITKDNIKKVIDWKKTKKDILYVFESPLMPYLEVGDTCYYKTRFNTTNTFTITRIEYSKSILQDIEGE